MTDYYTQRLKEIRQTRESRRIEGLPLQKPTAGVDPAASMQKAPAKKSVFDGLTPDAKAALTSVAKENPDFGAGVEAYATNIMALQKKYKGINLPEEMIQKEVQKILGGFLADGERASQQRMMQQQLQQQRTGQQQMNQIMEHAGAIQAADSQGGIE